MECSVLLFAQLAEEIGSREIAIELPEGATVADALDALSSRHELIRVLRDRIAIAVDERYANAETTLEEGCTVALIPPVSGG